jgi:hypothetical protein
LDCDSFLKSMQIWLKYLFCENDNVVVPWSVAILHPPSHLVGRYTDICYGTRGLKTCIVIHRNSTVPTVSGFIVSVTGFLDFVQRQVLERNFRIKRRVSSVSMVTTLRAGRPGFDFRQEFRIFLLSTASRPALGPTQPRTQWIPGGLAPGVKRPGREADHSPLSSAEVKNAWRYTSTSPYVFVTCLIKQWVRLPLPYTSFRELYPFPSTGKNLGPITQVGPMDSSNFTCRPKESVEPSWVGTSPVFTCERKHPIFVLFQMRYSGCYL